MQRNITFYSASRKQVNSILVKSSLPIKLITQQHVIVKQLAILCILKLTSTYLRYFVGKNNDLCERQQQQQAQLQMAECC